MPSKTKSFFEPWFTTKSTRHGLCPELIPDDPEVTMRIQESWDRLDKKADWIIWGTGVAKPVIVQDLLTREVRVTDENGIMVVVRHSLARPETGPTHAELADRIAACVNACAGIRDPQKFISDTRAMVFDLVRGEYDSVSDTRAVSLLSRCIPPEEIPDE